jgi:hypothetical protein
MINQKEGTVHSHDNKSDIVKVIITTISIILFNYEDGSVNYSKLGFIWKQ